MRDRFLGGEQQAEHVEVELLAEVLLVYGFERAELINVRVVDEDIDSAELRLGFVEQFLDVLGFRDVGLDGDRIATRGFDLIDDGLCALLIGRVIDDDVGAFGPNCPAIAAPIPLEAPVTTATFPFSFGMIFPFAIECLFDSSMTV